MLKLNELPFFDTFRNLYLYRYYRGYNPSRVESLKNIFEGERCFLIGTGPSLNKTNLNLLKDEITFGTNTAYKTNFRFSYYCVSDKDVWENNKTNILNQRTQLILSGHAGRDYLLNENEYRNIVSNDAIILKDLGDIKRKGWIDKNLVHGSYWGNTIMVDCCLQVAYYMGFSKVFLLGCDCNYNQEHHFDNETYLFQNNSPDYYDEHWKKVFDAHKIIKEEYEKNNRTIYNATPDSTLDIYEKVNLGDII